MKLIPMTTFVLEQIKEKTGLEKLGGVANALHVIHNYANFLKQPLEIWMFVTCDDNGVVLDEPKTTNIQDANFDIDEMENWNKAKDRVLFEGFTFKEIKTSYEHYYIVNNEKITWLSWNKSKTVENLLDYNQEIKLTKSAIKQIGL